MADDTKVTFGIDLDATGGKEVTDQADALQQLQERLDSGTRALSAMTRAMRQLKGAAQPNEAAIGALEKRLAQTRNGIAATQAKFIQLGGTFGRAKRVKPEKLKIDRADVPKPPKEIDEWQQVLKGFGSAGGPIGKIASKLGSLKLGAVAAAAGIAAVAAAMLAVAAAAAAAYAALARYGLAQADARRAELLRLEGLTKIRFWNQRAADSGSMLQSTIDGVSSSVALSRGDVSKYAEQLYRAGLRGGFLQQVLKGMSTVASVQGDEQAQLWRNMAIGAVRAGGSVKKLSDDVEARLGKLARRRMLELTVIQDKLRENFSLLFSDLKIEPILAGIKQLSDLFSQNTVTGRALKQLIETLFNPMIAFLEKHGILFKRFFQGLVIGAQLFVIALQSVAIWLLEAFGDSAIVQGMFKMGREFDTQQAAMLAGVAVFGALAGAVLAVGAAFTVAMTPMLIALGVLSTLFYTVKTLLEADWGKIGTNIVKGIADGIMKVINMPIDALKRMGRGMLDAMTSFFHIRSPSRVMAKLGIELPRGVAVGIRAGAPEAQQAVTDMISPESFAAGAVSIASGVRAGASAAGGNKVSVTIEHMTVGGSDARQQAQSFLDQMADALQGVNIHLAGVRS